MIDIILFCEERGVVAQHDAYQHQQHDIREYAEVQKTPLSSGIRPLQSPKFVKILGLGYVSPQSLVFRSSGHQRLTQLHL